MNGAGNPLDIWPAAASASAVETDYLILAFTVVILLLTVPIFVGITYFAFRYRAGRGGQPRAYARTASDLIELGWMIIPFVLTLVFFVWGAQMFDHAQAPAGRRHCRSTPSAGSGCGSSSIRAASRRSTTCMCRPAQPVVIRMISPGRDPRALHPGAAHPDGGAARTATRRLWFKADQPGTYHLFCSRILRHRPFGDGRAADHHDAGRLRRTG